MEFDLDKSDIISAIKKNYEDDIEFLVDIVDQTTCSYYSITFVIQKLFKLLYEHDRHTDIVNLLEKINNNDYE